jgi:hypothetical protein
MELSTFVSQSLKDIIDGVLEAQKYANSKGAKVNVYVYGENPAQNINFDVAWKKRAY